VIHTIKSHTGFPLVRKFSSW